MPRIPLCDLTGKVALVTGASRGIGRAVALALARHGAEVLVNSRKPEGAEAVAGAIRGLGRRAAALPADVCDPAAVASLADAAAAFAPRLDILVLNAGVSPVYTRAEAVSLEDWRATLETNLTGAFLCVRALAPRLAAQPGGRVLVMASIGALVGLPRLAAYNATKGGLLQLTRTLALEWARHGVTANALAPGFIETDMTAGLLGHAALRGSLLARIPLGRFGMPEDVAAAALFLVSDAAAYITGTVLSVDGGWTAT
ncbi:MAG: SDR family NAD(P)-dependent oxidoreductase [Candidatus Methylomirabilales bacterium]